MRSQSSTLGLGFVLALGISPLAACDSPDEPGPDDAAFRSTNEPATYNTGSYNVHLERTVRFNAVTPGSNADSGRALFGLAANLLDSDDSGALFEGASQVYGGPVVSNGRTCFSCHRGSQLDLGLPAPPLSDTIALTDPLFTGVSADAGSDPDAESNLDQHGLTKYRPNRFNLARDAEDPFKQVFGWRKAPHLVNVGFSHGFLTDLRGRTMFETARGAVFSHTQGTDSRFDELFPQQSGDDIAAFLFAQVSDPALLALRDPSDPMHQVLVDDPFYTVPVSTNAEKAGQKLFEKHCFACHDTPNVFNNLSNVSPIGNGERPNSFPSFAPAIGKGFDVGVAEANLNGLRFTRDMEDGTFQPIVLPLAGEDGSLVEFEVDRDVGLAATSGRYEDVGRFKVPQLRNLAAHAPYFHDNSIDTLEGVVDYFCSDAYNQSKDGQLYPINMSPSQRQQLVAFLELL